MTEIKSVNGPDEKKAYPRLWRSLYYFNLYRLVLSGGLITLAISRVPVAHFGENEPALFLFAAVAMLSMSLINTITITNGKPSFRFQSHTQFAADIVIITLLMHSSNGVASGLGLLIVISVAGAGVIFSGRKTLFYAAIASLFPLLEHTYSVMLGLENRGTFTEIGLLGASLFATGFILFIISSRIQVTEQLAEKRARDIVRLNQINQEIVERIDTGVLVTDDKYNIQLINQTGRSFLGMADDNELTNLHSINQHLARVIEEWLDNPSDRNRQVTAVSQQALLVRCLQIGAVENKEILVFLEDATDAHRQVQQIKLAALGRLTAAIAHEIRNPLGAVSHAGQLLFESSDIQGANSRLVEIIQLHCERINRIIRSILELGRKDTSRVEQIELRPWLQRLIEQLQIIENFQQEVIELDITVSEIRFNADHLQQIMSNLCNNALQHCRQPPGKGAIMIQAHQQGKVIELAVQDNGEGIDADLLNQIFEPFFTTSSQGTGLGLFISRELCEVNSSKIEYQSTAGQGARFAIQIPVQREPI